MNEKIKCLEFLKNEKINIIPLKQNEKIPAVQWQLYQEMPFSFDALMEHYIDNNYAAICGSISENLIIFDVDLQKEWKDAGNYLNNESIYNLYKEMINLTPIDTFIVKTPSGGLHFYFKLESMEPYKKLEQNKGLSCKFKVENVKIGHLDLQGEGKYAVIPPSAINGRNYEIYNKSPILKINEKMFNHILSKWTNIDTTKDKKTQNTLEKIAAINNVREPFKDILEGKLDIEKYAIETGKEKFQYFDGLFREYFHNEKFEPQKLFQKLKKNQPCFNIKETEKQLKHHPYTNKPYTNKKLEELFPDYQFFFITENREKLYEEFYNLNKTQAQYTRNGKEFETKAFKNWYRKNKTIQIEEKLKENDDIENLIQNITQNTSEEIIKKILKKISDFEPETINSFIIIMIEKTKKEKAWLNEQLEIIYIENLAKEQNINLNLLTITREQIKLLSSKLDLNRPGSITGFFLSLKKNCNLSRESICLILLPNIEDIMNVIIEKYPLFILNKTDDIYLYNESGVYIKQNKKPEEIIENLVINEIPFYIKQITGDVYFIRRVKTITKEIILRSYIEEDNLIFDILNFKNGILFLEDIKKNIWNLKPHNPKYRSIIQFNIPFCPFTKRSKKIKNFFIKQLGKEQFSRIKQLYGIAFVGTPWKWKAITFLEGKSGTGKSEFIFKTLETIIPPIYISYEPFTNLISDDDNFATGNLFGALINIHGEIEDKALTHPEGINKLTEEFISVNRKYGFKGKIKNRCSHFYAMNVAPQIPNEERIDVFRRIEFFKIIGDPIPENERDPDFFKNIIKNNPHELIAILNEILMELSEVLNKGAITTSSILNKREIYRQASLPLLSFINKWCDKFETDKKTKSGETYLIERHYFLKIYNQYRKELNIEKIENLWTLTDEEKKMPRKYRIYRTKKKNERYYMGIKFTAHALEHFNINIDKIKEDKIYYPEGIDYQGKQKKISEQIEEYNKEMYSFVVDLIEKDEFNSVYLENIENELLKKEYSKEEIKANINFWLEKKLFILTEKQTLEFNANLIEKL